MLHRCEAKGCIGDAALMLRSKPKTQVKDLVIPRHVAIIMDGNGRWASKRFLPRKAGHKAGVDAVRRVVRAAGDQGVEYITLYGFSSENWKRPATEVADLMGLLRHFIRKDLAELHESGVKVLIIGEREELSADVLADIEEAERLTQNNTRLHLTIAFNYGGHNEIVAATKRIARKVAAGELSPDEINCETIATHLDTAGIPDPDLVIRTSGEKRLSNFLIWQSAYSELVFLDLLWPDFDGKALAGAIKDFNERDRRFGGR